MLEPIKGLQITPAFDAVWTHVRREFDANNLVISLVASRYDRNIFSNSTDAISYSPSLTLSYQMTDLHGAVTKSVGTNTFVEYGIELGTSLQDKIISEISLGFTYVNAKNFDGSRVSISIEY